MSGSALQPPFALLRRVGRVFLDPPEKPGPQDPAYTRVQTALVTLLVCACVQHASLAMAQTGRAPAVGRFEVAAGPSWTGTTSVGTRDATLTASDRSRFRLFSTSSELGSAPGLEVRVAVRLARALDVEAVASYAIPRLITSVTADTEQGAATTASEPINQIAIEGGALVYLPRRFGPRLVPFVTAGGGYLQQFHGGQTLMPRGGIYHVGGGIKVPLVSHAAAQTLVKQVGVRVDARAVVRTAGATLDDRAHIAPALTASLFVRF